VRERSPSREFRRTRVRERSPSREFRRTQVRERSPSREFRSRIVNHAPIVSSEPSKTDIVDVLKNTIIYIEKNITLIDNKKQIIKDLERQDILNKKSIKSLKNEIFLNKYKVNALINKSEVSKHTIIKYQNDDIYSKIHNACLEQQIIELNQTILDLKSK
jgi:hypothetical protein